MVSLKYNKPASITIRYVGEGEVAGRLSLLPGYNLNVIDELEWEFALEHPTVQAMLETRELEVASRDPATSEMTVKVVGKDSVHEATYTVTKKDDPRTGQPLPVTGDKKKTVRRSRSVSEGESPKSSKESGDSDEQ